MWQALTKSPDRMAGSIAGRGEVWVTQSLTANNRSRAALTNGECVLSSTRAADRSRMGLAAAYDVTSPGR
jgi:hypothetical protein